MALQPGGPVEISAAEEVEGLKAIARWRRVFDLGADGPPPVGTPKEMREMLLRGAALNPPPTTIGRMLTLLDAMEKEGWQTVGVPDLVAGTKSSYYAARKYAVRAALSVANDASADLERTEVVLCERSDNLRRLRGALAFLDVFPPDPMGARGTDRSTWGTSRWHDLARLLAEHSKIHAPKRSTDKQPVLTVLRRLGDWRGMLWAAAREEPWLDAYCAAVCSGCRPMELVGGIEVSLVDDVLRLMISGVKLRDGDRPRDQHGQSYRTVDVAIDARESRHLARLVQRNSGPVWIRYDGDDFLDVDNATCRKKTAEAWNREILKLGKRALGPIFSEGRERLSPYVLRHAFSASMKASGIVPSDQQSMAMGHQSARTISGYGAPWQDRGSSGRGPTILGASAPVPVRNASPTSWKAIGRLRTGARDTSERSGPEAR
jgi:hypothetical protein